VATVTYQLLISDEPPSSNVKPANLEVKPASPKLLDAIQEIEVEDHTDVADMLRLRIAIGVKDGCSQWTVVDEKWFQPLIKIRLMVTVGSGPAEPLMEAYVIETNAQFFNQPGQSTFEVVAMDPTVLMNLKEKVRPWPDMADSDIAATLFDEHGFSATVEQTQPQRQHIDYTTTQRGTDIQFLRELAYRNGFECYVELNPRTGIMEGHFHSPRFKQTAQGMLTVNMGEATNINRFSARYDMLRPTTVRVSGLDIATQAEQKAEVDSLSLDELGAEPTLDSGQLRQILPSQMGLSQTGELQTYAQAVVNRSACAITADGDLNTVAYGGILRAKRPVEVRGASGQFSGTYYVQQVLHTFSGEGYSQRFTLRRNAFGLTGQERFTEDKALSSDQ
jgi:phage protein D